jgi:hypothetical protein
MISTGQARTASIESEVSVVVNQRHFESSTEIALIQQPNNETPLHQTARSQIPPKGIQPINWIPLHLGGELKEHKLT